MSDAEVESAQQREQEGIIDDDRFLLFTLNDERFATPLLGVREVVEPQEPKPIPNTPTHFLGMINIRGRIVGVIDLRTRFGYRVSESGNNSLMVFETDGGPIAAVVDSVEDVVRFDSKEIDTDPHLKTSVPVRYITGIAHLKDNLVTVVNLNQVLSDINLGK
jgi:purine-binding chemotaxis protein CheW